MQLKRPLSHLHLLFKFSVFLVIRHLMYLGPSDLVAFRHSQSFVIGFKTTTAGGVGFKFVDLFHPHGLHNYLHFARVLVLVINQLPILS